MRKWFAVLVLAAFSVGCTSQKFVKNTYGTLATFAAAYKVEEPAREAFCKGKVPQPKPCEDAYQAAVIGWTAFVESSDLLATYIETKDETTKARLVRLVPELIGSAVELTNVVREFK